MYTTRKSKHAKLRAYYRGLGERYRRAIARRRYDEAREIRERRRNVLRYLLLHEEFECEPVAA